MGSKISEAVSLIGTMGYSDMEMSEGRIHDEGASRFTFGAAGKALAAVAAVSAAALTVKNTMGGAVVANIAGVTQLEQMVVQGPRETCSPPWTSKSKAENRTENCMNTQCCSTTGYNCFQKEPGVAGCLKGCDTAKISGIAPCLTRS